MSITAAAVKELREKTGAGMMDCKKALTETDGNMEAAQDWLREKGIAKAAKKGDRIAAEGLTKVKETGDEVVILEINSETDFVAKNEQFINLLDEIADILLANKPANVEEALAMDVNGQTLENIITSAIATIGEKLTLRRFEIFTKQSGQEFGVYSHAGGKISTVTIIEGGNSDVAKDVSMHTAAINPKYKTQDEVPSDEVEKERKILTEEAMAEGKPAEIAQKMVEGRLRKYFAEIVLVEQAFVKDGDVTVGKFLANNNAKLIEVVRFEVGEGIEKEEVDFAAEVAAQANI